MDTDIDASANVTSPESGLVARRALILASLVCRGSIDTGAGNAEAESVRSQILEWVNALGLDRDLEEHERSTLHAELGRLEPRDVNEATWDVEGLAILAWSLGVRDLPRHDEKVDPYRVTESVRFLSDDAADLVRSAKLRSARELSAYRELVYAIHCRLRGFIRNRQGKDFAVSVDERWLRALNLDKRVLIVSGDLSIDGLEISRAEEGRVEDCEWITFRRHKAAIWVLGGYPLYSQVSVDT